MQLRIRCSECNKAILVDRAFAGGVCRCPYCKAIVPVPAVRQSEPGPRPDAPPRRPDTPPRRDDAPFETSRPPAPRPDSPVPKPRRNDDRSPVTADPADGPPEPSSPRQAPATNSPPHAGPSDASRADAQDPPPAESPKPPRAEPHNAPPANRPPAHGHARKASHGPPRTGAPGGSCPPGPADASARSAAPPASRSSRRKRRSRRRLRQALGLILLGVMVVGIAIAGTVLALRHGGGPDDAPRRGARGDDTGDASAPSGSRVDPFTITAPSAGVAGDIPVSPPVVYLVDAGAGMLDTLEYALDMVAASVASMSPEQRFAVVLLKDTADHSVRILPAGADGLAPAGRSAAEALRRDTRSLYAGGSVGRVEQKALRQAVELQPATLVLLTNEELDASVLGDLLDERDIRLVTVTLGSYPRVRRRMADLTRKLGGTFRAYDVSTLAELAGPNR